MAATTTRRCRVGLLPDFNQPPPTVFEFSASVLPNRVKKPEFLSKAFIPWRTLKEIGIGLLVFQQFGGINGVGFYVSETFVEAGFPSGKMGTIAYAIIQVQVTVLGALLIDKSGRRPLIMVLYFDVGDNRRGKFLKSNPVSGTLQTTSSLDGFHNHCKA